MLHRLHRPRTAPTRLDRRGARRELGGRAAARGPQQAGRGHGPLPGPGAGVLLGLLPGLGGVEDHDRSIISIEAKENSSFLPIEKATISLKKGNFKIIYYLGYEKYDQQFELYDLHDDPHELKDIFHTGHKHCTTAESRVVGCIR